MTLHDYEQFELNNIHTLCLYLIFSKERKRKSSTEVQSNFICYKKPFCIFLILIFLQNECIKYRKPNIICFIISEITKFCSIVVLWLSVPTNILSTGIHLPVGYNWMSLYISQMSFLV